MKIAFTVEGATDEAVIPILVQRVLGFYAEPVIRRRRRRGLGGLLRELPAEVRQFERLRADGIVVVVDAGNESAVLRENQVRNKLHQSAVPIVVGVAVKELEAWLLSDEKSIADAVGAAFLPRQPDPETVDEPKNHFNGLIGEFVSRNPALRENLFQSIAANLDLQVLRKRSPSFDRFADQLQRAFGPIRGV